MLDAGCSGCDRQFARDVCDGVVRRGLRRAVDGVIPNGTYRVGCGLAVQSAAQRRGSIAVHEASVASRKSRISSVNDPARIVGADCQRGGHDGQANLSGGRGVVRRVAGREGH
jgi:hypothetical protein